MPRIRRVATPESFSDADPPTVSICNKGDILIHISDSHAQADHYYRCSREVLRRTSEYFNVLLDPVKFSEGIAVEERIQDLTRRYDSTATIPASELPKVVVSDVGDIPKAYNSSSTVIRLFFEILHDPSTPWPVPRAQSVNLIALLSIIADRFDCLNTTAEYLRRQGLETALLKARKSATAHKTELDNRQRLLAGSLFGFPEWVRQCSAALIIDGTRKQVVTNIHSSEDEERGRDEALWWRLPGGIEGTFLSSKLDMSADHSTEELEARRNYVLDTLSSIQKHFIDLYISRQPQCRLGYSSSPQCDSYQLGEMVRFFCRKGTLRFESCFDSARDCEEVEPYTGNLNDVIAKLKECPSYQIDGNHYHCGLRNRLMNILEGNRPLRPSQAGICLGCWQEDKSGESWLENPTGGTWAHSAGESGEWVYGRGCRAHRDIKAMYTAAKRDWTPVT